MNEQNLNLSIDGQTLEQCLKIQSNLTNTHYYNICNGDEYNIPYGVVDYIGWGLLFSMLFFIVSLLFVALLKMIFGNY